jgi:hypothetical protein
MPEHINFTLQSILKHKCIHLFCFLASNKNQITTNFEHIPDDQQFASNMMVDKPNENEFVDNLISTGELSHLMFHTVLCHFEILLFSIQHRKHYLKFFQFSLIQAILVEYNS